MKLILVLINLMLICLPACGRHSNEDFIQSLHDSILKNPRRTVRLSEFTGFKWDTVAFYGPYVSIEHIIKETGYRGNLDIGNYSLYEQTDIAEGQGIMIFLYQGKAVKGIVHSRLLLDTGKLSDKKFSVEQAVFKAEIGEEDRPVLN